MFNIEIKGTGGRNLMRFVDENLPDFKDEILKQMGNRIVDALKQRLMQPNGITGFVPHDGSLKASIRYEPIENGIGVKMNFYGTMLENPHEIGNLQALITWMNRKGITNTPERVRIAKKFIFGREKTSYNPWISDVLFWIPNIAEDVMKRSEYILTKNLEVK